MFNIFLLINDRCTKLTNKMINLNWPITKKARYVRKMSFCWRCYQQFPCFVAPLGVYYEQVQ